MTNILKGALAAVALLGAQGAFAHDSNAPLRAAYDGGFAPFAFVGDDGNLTGFTYDLGVALAAQMGRPGTDLIDTPFSSIFAGLQSDRYELIIAPVNGNEERAKTMLFSEPYLATESSVMTLVGNGVASLEELAGKTIAVNNGSGADKEATAWAEEYGFSVDRYNSQPDAIRAVLTGRADATMADASASLYVAAENPQLEVSLRIPVGVNVSFFFRKDDVDFRNEVEVALECMKTNGAFAEIYTKWFGIAPPAGTPQAEVFPGYGAPGYEGYDATEHTLSCD